MKSDFQSTQNAKGEGKKKKQPGDQVQITLPQPGDQVQITLPQPGDQVQHWNTLKQSPHPWHKATKHYCTGSS